MPKCETHFFTIPCICTQTVPQQVSQVTVSLVNRMLVIRDGPGSTILYHAGYRMPHIV